MKKLNILLVTVLSLVFLNGAFAQDGLPIPGYPASRDYPGAHLTPDANTEYKVVFDFAMADDNLDDPYPMLPLLARYVNTLANLGVPKENRKIAVVMHQGSGLIGLKNDQFKARNNGKDNPNIELIRQLHQAGVTFHLCGQGVLARGIEESDLLDEIQVDYWALTTLIELGRQGYVKIGG
ncbi:MAG: DsrE family protein [Gammaproteobacteria bacterium]|nr:DsrE family protein [Pseudomonadales bacterium]MCP5349195.1 DsrE family protein [Pseudomonadales bacterium]